jgi:hypothetical protein
LAIPQAIDRLLATPRTKPRFPARIPEACSPGVNIPGCVMLDPDQRTKEAAFWNGRGVRCV